MLPRRHLRRIPLARTTAQPPSVYRRRGQIEADRKRLLDEMALLSAAHGPSARPIATAMTLLTTWWTRSALETREQLIKAADWLVRLECKRGPQRRV